MSSLIADLVLRDAPFYGDGRWAGDALAIAGGRIVALGSVADVAATIGPATEVRSLAGRWLIPAFHDSHVHPVAGGLERAHCDLTGTAAVEDYLDLVGRYAAAHPDREWITGGGWSMDSFPGGVPTAALLDRVCPERPVYLPNRDHHSAWVNSAALALAGIDASTPDPEDGRIERDPDGRPTGALHEGAMGLVARHVPRPTPEDLLDGLLRGQAYLHSIGVAGWQDALVGDGLGMSDTLPTYLEATRRGLLTGKPVLALWWDRERGLDQVPELIGRRARAAEAGLSASSVKIMQDGVCETHTAALLDSYVGADGHPTGSHGLSFIEASDLATYVAELDRHDFQVHVHALGDRAVRDSLDAVAHARVQNGDRGNRHQLAHLQIVQPEDVARFAELGAIATCQPLWACLDEAMADLTLPFLPANAQDRQYVFGSLERAGARLAFGSDWPVSSAEPLWGIHVAVNRRAPQMSTDAAPLQPEEALDLRTALHAYTAGSAYVNRADLSTGALALGMAADIAVIDTDILACAPSGLATIGVTNTYVDGREVYALSAGPRSAG